MHIVSAADDGYIPHFAALLHSAWLYHPQASFYLLASNLAEANLALLGDFARQRDISLEIIDCADRTAGLRIRPGITASTWSRLFIPHLLPASVDRVIYLDADITVIDSLDGLLAMDMGGQPVAAAPDGVESTAVRERTTHGTLETSDYFNAGVLLFDLAMWRAEEITEKIVSFARATEAELFLLDQSALNVVLEGRIRPFGKEWNFYYLADIPDVPDPKIIHYAGMAKPWLLRLSPFYDLYRFHRSHTPWPLIDVPFPPGGWLKMQRRRFAACLGLERYRSKGAISGPALDRARALLADRNAKAEPGRAASAWPGSSSLAT